VSFWHLVQWITSNRTAEFEPPVLAVSAPPGRPRRRLPRLRREIRPPDWQSGGQRFDPAWLHNEEGFPTLGRGAGVVSGPRSGSCVRGRFGPEAVSARTARFNADGAAIKSARLLPPVPSASAATSLCSPTRGRPTTLPRSAATAPGNSLLAFAGRSAAARQASSSAACEQVSEASLTYRLLPVPTYSVSGSSLRLQRGDVGLHVGCEASP
jgi:hypothetical protein